MSALPAGRPAARRRRNAVIGTVAAAGSAASSATAASIAGSSARNAATNALANTGKGSASSGAAVSTSKETMVPLAAFTKSARATRRWRSTIRDCSSPPRFRSTWRPANRSAMPPRRSTRRCGRSACRASIHGSFAGTAQTFQQSLNSEPVLIAAALIAVYIVLGVLYESYIHPITILSTLPSAGVGAVLALLDVQHRIQHHRR